ncbi:MAG: hypothetical protein JRM76_06680 [Nitrososphaerota archaeon]|jgi:hypothetical protein|nr:hypothetical protein [Nitrososphaerota archaeon]MDG6912552.1 hypothetical protein [Nitrososphaerota archaeon]MDG6937629.1 hypothetical protein [Nitrososphaerota archaeon]MDG6962045.1 hypothetical protein [Nitrososphaerota archaeon]MDG6970603.1 hypothetical protein [Nitrososphaerota archaeon]
MTPRGRAAPAGPADDTRRQGVTPAFVRVRRGVGVSTVVAVELMVLAVAGIAAAIYESGVETYWCGTQQPIINGTLVLACAITQRVEGTFLVLGVGGILASLFAWVMRKLLTMT